MRAELHAGTFCASSSPWPLRETLARQLVPRGSGLPQPGQVHAAEDRRCLGELDLVVLDDLESVAPGIMEVEAAPGQDLHPGLLQRRAHGGLVVDDQAEVAVIVGTL